MKTAVKPSANDSYSVSGLVIHARPSESEKVKQRLIAIEGVDVHAVSEIGKMVVTVEEMPGAKTMIDTISQVNHTEGVINASLVYCESENDAGEEPDSNTSLDASNIETPNLDASDLETSDLEKK